MQCWGAFRTGLGTTALAAAEEQRELLAETESLVAPSVVNIKADKLSVVASQVTDVIKLTDVAALLPRREFKIHSGQIF